MCKEQQTKFFFLALVFLLFRDPADTRQMSDVKLLAHVSILCSSNFLGGILQAVMGSIPYPSVYYYVIAMGTYSLVPRPSPASFS